jgi:predicted DNA-binding protein
MQYLKYFNKLDSIPDEVTVNKEAFEKEAVEMGLSHLEDFYNSVEFKNKNRLEENKIVCKI